MTTLSSTRFAVLFGSQSGNSALVAEAMVQWLVDAGFEATLLSASGPTAIDFPDVDVLLVCTSSHGNGELPDNLAPVHRALVEQQADLSHLAYAVVCLGDMTYAATFCGAGRTMDAALEKLGAKRLLPPLEVDVSITPFAENPVLAWMADWISEPASVGGPTDAPAFGMADADARCGPGRD